MPRLPPLALALAALATLATPLRAQSTGTLLDLRVRDAAGGTVPLATVIAESDGIRLLRTTSDSGRATLPLPRNTRVVLSIRRIGYVPVRTTVETTAEQQPLTVTMSRAIPWALDTVRVTARRTVGGIVVAAATQEPVAGATVTLTGGGQRIVTAADGSFTLPLDRRRTLTLVVRAPGYAPAFRTERLDADASGDYLILLDSLASMSNVTQANLWDAERRITWRGSFDASVGGRELRATGAATITDAARLAPSLAERGLRAGDAACVFINGEPAPGQSLSSIPVDRVTMVELYEQGGEMIASLVNRWPKGVPCAGASPERLQQRASGQARWAVVWMR